MKLMKTDENEAAYQMQDRVGVKGNRGKKNPLPQMLLHL